MKIYRDVKQRSEEWFRLREKKMTASKGSVIAVAGKGLETYIYELMCNSYKKSHSTYKYLGKDVERGNELEPQAAQIYSFETGNKIENIGFVEYNQYVGCSPDIFSGENGLCEIKCPNDTNFYRILMTDEVEKKYKYQCHMQMIVCQKEWCDLFNYNPNFTQSFHRVRFKKDEKIEAELIKGFKKGEKLIKKLTRKSEAMKL